MKKAVLGLAVIFLLLGGVAGLFGWTAVRRNSPEQESTEAEIEEVQEPEEELEETAVSEPEEAQVQGEEPEPGRLAYWLLSDAEVRTAYEEIRAACEEQTQSVRLSTLDEDVIALAWEAVSSDCGEMFWVSGYTYTLRTVEDEVVGIDFSPTYTMSSQETGQYQSVVSETVADYLARISADASDYEKVKYVYEMLIYNVDYVLDSEENQNILSVFLYGESVCNGIASAAQYLLTLLDVPCMIVHGSSQGELHAWDLVYIDGEPYFFDATWGCTASANVGDCTYAYLNLTSEELAKTHEIDMAFDVPECTSVNANYYVREGLYLTEFDGAQIGNVLAAGYASGDRITEIKCSSDELYQQVKTTFLDEMKLSEYCAGLTRIGYVENTELRVLTLQWQ